MEKREVVKITNKNFFLRQHVATRTELLYEDLRQHLCKVSEQINQDPVLYTPQQKSQVEQAVARMNIGAVSVEEVLELIEVEFPDLIQDIIDRIEEIEEQIENRINPMEISFSNQSEVHVVHNLGRYPNVKVLIGTDTVLAPVEHMTNKNELYVRFSKPLTGLIVLD